MNHLIKNHKGQNVVEYLLLTVAMVLVLLVFMHPRGSVMKNAMEKTLGSTVDKINMIGQELKFNASAN